MEKRIYYHDTDAGGVVYYGRYLNYLEEARTEFLERTGFTVKALHEKGFLYAVRKCSVTYLSPARYGDILICDCKLEKLTAAQMFFKQTIVEKETKRPILEADVVLVSLTIDFKPTAIPEEVREKLSKE